MNLNDTDLELLNRLVGPLSEHTAAMIKKKIDCFLHPKVSLFIPSSGQCEYAVTPNHIHPAYSFIYHFQPINEFIVEGRKISYPLSDGRCLSAMSPNIPHQEVVRDHFESYIAILLDAEFFEKTLQQYCNTIPIFRGEIFAPHPELLGTLRCFMLEASDNSHKNPELLNNLAVVIAHLIVHSVTEEAHPALPLYDRFEVDRAIAYMNSHISEKIIIDDLADRVNLSSGHFSKIFKTVTGAAPIDYLNNLRIRKACGMLANNVDNITEIALKCGFNTSSYFSTCFLEKYKMSPSAYRQKFQMKQESYDSEN